MLTNSDITIYNAYYDKGEKLTKYNRTYIRGVNFQQIKATKLTDKGLLSANTAEIFIPFTADTEGKQYIKPKEYKRLSDIERNSYFTFNNDDKVVKGIIDFKLTGIELNNTKNLNEMYDDVYSIMSIDICDYGSISMQHWAVGAK